MRSIPHGAPHLLVSAHHVEGAELRQVGRLGTEHAEVNHTGTRGEVGCQGKLLSGCVV